jgi:predicted RNA-binding protein with PIN domain
MILVDGYNLLHALGMAPRPGGMSLERARVRFAEWLAIEMGPRVSLLKVVFDGRDRGGPNEHQHRGVRMIFSAGEKADDLIERMIRDEPNPARLTVVSSDSRIAHAARRRGCAAQTCGEFLDSLSPPPRAPSSAMEKPEKPDTPGDEIDEWLKAFEP